MYNFLRSNKLLLSFLILSLVELNGKAQSGIKRTLGSDTAVNVVEIDPRQYVVILYNRFRTREQMETIWNWENRKNVPFQKFHSLDKEGQIRIEFDKGGLIRNTDFFGNITLEAEISGPKGTRQIEVNPYSEIGVERKAIGIKSDPPFEVSNKLLSMLAELSAVDTISQSLNSSYSFRSKDEFAKLGDILRKYIKEIDQKSPDLEDIRFKVINALDDFYSTTSYPPDYYYYYLQDSTKNDKLKLKATLNNLKTYSYTNYNKFVIDSFRINYKAATIFLQDKLPLILEFLNSFEIGGQEGLKAFLSLTNLTFIKYMHIKNNLIKDEDTLSMLRLPTKNNNDLITDSLLLLYKEPIERAINSLYNLSNLQGSQIERIILKYANDHVQDKSSMLKSVINYGSSIPNGRLEIRNLINNYKDSLSILIARKAGEQIYKKLIKASIDLGKSGANEGETLCLYLTWILDGSDSMKNSPRIEIGKYQIVQSGWSLDVSDMFSLVNRIHPSTTIDPTHTSPSIFKGAGGAVLMWTYSKEDKGLNIKQNENEYRTRRKNVLMNFLQPSIGINVSYLDFNTSKDVEIGTGIQVGVFHNKIYFGYGANLNLMSPKDAPYYFFLGFSFAKLSDLFKDSGKIGSNN